MIVGILIVAFIALVGAMVFSIQFPAAIPQIQGAIDAMLYYIGQAMDIVWLFVPKEITIACMGLTIGVQVIVMGYHFVMWILNKIPMAGID